MKNPTLVVFEPSLLKAHVKSYTRKDGTVVKEHDDKRQAARPAQAAAPKAAAQSLPNHWRDAHDHAVNASYAAWNDGGSHEDAIAALKHSAKLHAAAAKAAKDDGADDAAKHHAEKAKAHKEAIKQHEGHASGSATHPQSDSNEANWDKLPDDENPRFSMTGLSSIMLGKISKGEVDMRDQAKSILASRGMDESGKWVGFGRKPEIDPQIWDSMSSTNTSILSAAAQGHLDMGRLAGKELANRGHNHEGAWIGFDAANKLHSGK